MVGTPIELAAIGDRVASITMRAGLMRHHDAWNARLGRRITRGLLRLACR